MNYCKYNNEEINLLDEIISYINSRQYEKALEFMNNSQAFDDEDPLLMMSKAQCYLRIDERKKANEIYENVINLCDKRSDFKKLQQSYRML